MIFKNFKSQFFIIDCYELNVCVLENSCIKASTPMETLFGDRTSMDKINVK